MNTRIALITGANKGIGFETSRQLAELGWTVWLGARDEARGAAAAHELSGLPGTVRYLPMDVTVDASVQAAVEEVRASSGRLDVLVNNAGIGGRFVGPAETTPADFLPVFGVNLLGPVRVTGAFLPLLRAGVEPRLVMVSSGMGSFGITTDPERIESTLHGLVYPSSKAALNMVTSMYAKALTGIRVYAVDPGYTATDLNGHRGTQRVEEGAEPVIMACTAPTLPGTFVGRAGALPW